MGISPKEEKFINNLQQEILEYLELNDDRSFSVNQLHKAFAIRDRKTKEIIWQYGEKGKKGFTPGLLNYPDGVDLDVFRDWKTALKK